MKNSARIDKLDKRLRPLKKEYADKAWKIAKRLYDVGDHEQRRLAYETICRVDYEAAWVLAAIRPPENINARKERE